MHLFRFLTAALITILALSPSLAAGKKNKDKRDATTAIKKKLSAADLPADVREKVNKVLTDDSPKLKDAQAKVDAILTTEQKQARQQAQKEAKANGTKIIAVNPLPEAGLIRFKDPQKVHGVIGHGASCSWYAVLRGPNTTSVETNTSRALPAANATLTAPSAVVAQSSCR